MCQNGLAFGMVPAGAEMKSDTKIIGAVIGMGMLLVSVMAFQSASTNARFDDINARFDRMDTRFDGVDARFDRMDARFDRMDARFDRMDTRIDGMQYEFTTRIDGLQYEFTTRIDGLQNEFTTRIDGLQNEFSTRIDDLRSDMREDHAAIHMRLDGLQETVSEIAQRLSRVEGRLGMPGGDGQATP